MRVRTTYRLGALRKIVLALWLFPLLWLQAQNAEDDGIPPVPALQTAVYDKADMLTPAQENALKEKLIRYADSTSTQIVIVTIPSLEGRNINFFAAQWAHKWGIGQKGKDNGVLILVAKKDRKLAIQVGYGMEHLLTDAMSRRIIELVIVPYFKQGDYYGGLDAGTSAIIKVMAGEYTNDNPAGGDGENDWVPLLVFILFFIIFLIIIIRNKGGGSSGSGGREVIFGEPPVIILHRGGRGGFGGFGGGGSFGGGGFGGGFGGGGFGGGGASGGW